MQVFIIYNVGCILLIWSFSQATKKVFEMRVLFFIGSPILLIFTTLEPAVDPANEFSEVFLRD